MSESLCTIGLGGNDSDMKYETTRFVTYTKEQYDKALAMYAMGSTVAEITRALDIPRQVIAPWVERRTVPRCMVGSDYNARQLVGSFATVTQEKAFLSGVLVGDGSLIESTHAYQLQACDRELVDETLRCLKAVYGTTKATVRTIAPRRPDQKTSYMIVVGSVLMYRELMAFFDGHAPRCRTWRVPSAISASASHDIKAAFVRGFADSEAHVDGRRRIELYSLNEVGLRQVGSLLNDLGIEWWMREKPRENTDSCFVLTVQRQASIRIYQRLVGFTIPRKARALEQIVSAYSERGSTSETELSEA